MSVWFERIVVVTLMIAVVGIQVAAVVRCARARRWWLMLVALVGAFQIRVDWATGTTQFDWLLLTFVGVSADWGTDWLVLGASFPAGALLVREMLTRGARRAVLESKGSM